MNRGVWSFYNLLVTFMGISPGGARESSPWREPWEQTRTARRPGGAQEPFHGDSPIAGHEGPSYALMGRARLWAGPTGLSSLVIFEFPERGFDPGMHKTGPTRSTRHQGANAG